MDWISDRILELSVGVFVIVVGWAGWVSNAIWNLKGHKLAGDKRDEATLEMIQLLINSSKEHRDDIKGDLKDLRLDLTKQHEDLKDSVKEDFVRLDTKIDENEKKRSDRSADIWRVLNKDK